jgi:ribonuclease P/MRP protein subunit POP3
MKSAKEQRAKARVAAKKSGAKPRLKKCLLTTARPDA